jgi:hypothetical protein
MQLFVLPRPDQGLTQAIWGKVSWLCVSLAGWRGLPCRLEGRGEVFICQGRGGLLPACQCDHIVRRPHKCAWVGERPHKCAWVGERPHKCAWGQRGKAHKCAVGLATCQVCRPRADWETTKPQAASSPPPPLKPCAETCCLWFGNLTTETTVSR